jgi:phosphopantothenoylcysteine decarboxylase/phosphopantothenate--cysteine ligase
MRDTAVRLASAADIFIAVAAVADYTPARPAAQKIKKGLPKQRLELVSTPDIVAEVAAMDDGPFTIGFAAETEKLKEHASGKLTSKRLDMIAANRVGQDDSGFESENNEILILVPDGEKYLGKGSKQELARLLMAEVATRIKEIERIETCPDKSTRPASGS